MEQGFLPMASEITTSFAMTFISLFLRGFMPLWLKSDLKKQSQFSLESNELNSCHNKEI
jgi:hypothetical protein